MTDKPLRVTDPEMLRAFAHPVRQRILRDLAVREHSRAVDLAQRLDVPANAVSFHLRTLAKAGLIEEAPEHARDRRDHVWRLIHTGGYSFDAEDLHGNLDGFLREQLGWIQSILLSRSETAADSALQQATVAHLGSALLTRAELGQLEAEVEEVLSRWRRHGAEREAAHPGGPERRVHNLVFVAGPADAQAPATSRSSSSKG